MISEVLHGEGKPRFIFAEAAAVLTGSIETVINEIKIQLTGSPVFTDALLNEQISTKNYADEITKGKIIAYNQETLTLTVDGWDNMFPVAGADVTIQNKIIDLPYCQSLEEIFTVDAFPTKKRWNGKLRIKLKGIYYSAILDYSGYANAELIQMFDEVFNTERASTFTFIPRKDNKYVNYECDLDPETKLQIKQLTRHQGHEGFAIKILCVNRLSKLNTTTLEDLPGIHKIIMDDEYAVNS